MTQTGTAGALRKALTKIKSLTAAIVRDAEYDLGEPGMTQNHYQRQRAARKHARAVGKLRGHLRRGRLIASSLDPTATRLFFQIGYATEDIVECCDDFPNDREWAGLAPLSKQIALIDEVRLHLMGAAK